MCIVGTDLVGILRIAGTDLVGILRVTVTDLGGIRGVDESYMGGILGVDESYMEGILSSCGMRSAERRKVNVLELKRLRSLVGVSRMDRFRNENVLRIPFTEY